MKKICILTQPLHTNYGGLLQTYALQTVLKRMGHEVWTEDRKWKRPLIVKLKQWIARLIKYKGLYYSTDKQEQIIAQKTIPFIHKYISTTEPIYSNTKKEFNKYHFDVYIVGSDQVWRPIYSYCLSNYFLDFTVGQQVKRIAYAASFGTSDWEFTEEQTRKCAALAKQFDKISVREDSGVMLCKKYLGVDAIHLLDPTMLLNKEDYIRLVEQEKTPTFREKLMTYVLDQSKEKQAIVRKVSQTLGLSPNPVMPDMNFSQVGKKYINQCVFPPVTDWLRGFMDSEFVVTDSFHGTVFSILFNKPFIVMANSERGTARLTSLLKKFELEERWVHSLEDVTDKILHGSVDFEKANEILGREREKANKFLIDSLNI
ncbi:polysaccharide pyruvyl transferase family protein [Bacteroides congonensis]